MGLGSTLVQAEDGDADAQFKLAGLYKVGRGVEQNIEEAVAYYTKAAEQGHVDAMYKLAAMYASGDGVERNADTALKWHMQADKAPE